MPNEINLSNFSENLILNFMLTGATVTRPTSWYVGFFSDAKGLLIDEPTIELSGAGYTRQPVSFSYPNNGSCSNTSAASFLATGDWLPINYVGIFNSFTNGDLLFWGELQNEISISDGGEIHFSINTITVSID